MTSLLVKTGYFFFGVGLVNVASYTTLKNYQERNKAILDEMMKKHEKFLIEK